MPAHWQPLFRGLMLLSLARLAASDATFSASVAAPTSAMAFPILDCIGAQHAEMLMWAVSREHLASVARDIGIRHLRGHGLLNDDMSAFLHDCPGSALNGHANLFAVFNLMDFLRSINMRPIVELSFTPGGLASDPAAGMLWYRANNSPPKNDGGEWSAFIAELVSGLVARYGIEEVRQWRFEVYNEPNCNFFAGNQSQYYSMYNTTAHAIKGVDQLLQVGGPASCQLGWIEDTLAFARSSGAPIDFISTHLYPTDSRVDRNVRDSFTQQLAQAAANVTRLGRPGMPLVLTEMNAGLQLVGPIDTATAYSASFLLHTHLALQGIDNLQTASYWSYTDVFEETGLDSTPYHNGWGIQTIWGIKKPVYRAFEILSQLPPTTVPVAVTNSSGGAPEIHRHYASAGTLDVAVAVDRSLSPLMRVTVIVINWQYWNLNCSSEQATVFLTGFPPGATLPANATVELIDSTHAWAQGAWQAAGSPLYPTAAELALEEEASRLVAEPLALERRADGAAAFVLTLEAYAVARVRFDFE